MEDINNIEEILKNHAYDYKIFKKSDAHKKKESILDSLVVSIVRSKMTIEDLNNFLTDIRNDDFFNIDIYSLLKNGGNIWELINKKWLVVAKNLWRQRSVGLGTPNSASGEGELFFIFTSKDIIKPSKGDLSIKDEIFELKGEGPRVMGNISGKNFNKEVLKIAEKFNLIPNKAKKNNFDAVEIEKATHIEHWKKELNKLSDEDKLLFLDTWLSFVNINNPYDSNDLFINGIFNHDKFIKTIVKLLFAHMRNDFNNLVLLGDGTDITTITNKQSDFDYKIDNGILKYNSNYFRINQNTNIGWYIS